MKKLIALVLSFFLFSITVWADNIVSNISIDMEILENGSAEINEEWTINSQENNCYTKDILIINDNEITDFLISDQAGKYRANDNSNLEKREYQLKKDDDKYHVYLCTNGKDETFNIHYKVSNVVVDYQDVSGINWLFLGNKRDYRVNNLSVIIKSFADYEENNTALYGIGDNLSLNFLDGQIAVSASDISRNKDVRLLTTFHNIKYKSEYHINKDFKSVYNATLHENNFLQKMKTFVKEEIRIFIIGIIVITLAIILIHYLLITRHKNDEYRLFKIHGEDVLPEINDVDYYDHIPENKDIFKIYFVANYFNLIKNKSDLICAIVLKWFYEDRIKIIEKDDTLTIKLINDDLKNQIEEELYNLLKQASNRNSLDKPKINRYVKEHYQDIINWYDRVFELTKEAYISENVITKQGRYYILNSKFFNIGCKIQGLKKYLLNFNQVPRRTSLTEEIYLYLLVMAELLGIASSVSSEILRKNPDNVMAQNLQTFERAKRMLKDIYNDAYSYNKTRK